MGALLMLGKAALGPLARLAGMIPWYAYVIAAFALWGGINRADAARHARAQAAAESRVREEAANLASTERERALEQAWQKRLEKANDDYRERLAAEQHVFERTALEPGRLRDAAAGALKPTGTSPPAGAASGADGRAVVLQVLGECGSALRQMAGDAGQDAARLKGLQDYVRATKQAAP